MELLLGLLCGEIFGGIAVLGLLYFASLWFAEVIVTILFGIFYILMGITAFGGIFKFVEGYDSREKTVGIIIFLIGLGSIFAMKFRQDLHIKIGHYKYDHAPVVLHIDNRCETERIVQVRVKYSDEKETYWHVWPTTLAYTYKLNEENEKQKELEKKLGSYDSKEVALLDKESTEGFMLCITTQNIPKVYKENSRTHTLCHRVYFPQKYIYPNGTRDIYVRYNGNRIEVDTEGVTFSDEPIFDEPDELLKKEHYFNAEEFKRESWVYK